jgi:phosphoglycolate phosphatase
MSAEPEALPEAAPITTVLFDLDGTLADTAPDLAHALNAVLRNHGREPLPYARIRPAVSHGGVALIRLGFGIDASHATFDALRRELLSVYQANIARETRLFDGMPELLAALHDRGLAWGVVTNKPAWLTDPLMAALGLVSKAACIVSGDTTRACKPDPLPMLHACELAGCAPQGCVYVGDAERDIEAGQRAGMHTLVALYGYIEAGEVPQSWGADALISHPGEVLEWVTRHNGSPHE